jgi:hypothetical protein
VAYQRHREGCIFRQEQKAAAIANGTWKPPKAEKQVKAKTFFCPHAGDGPDACKEGPWSCQGHLTAHLEKHEFQSGERCPRFEVCGNETIFSSLTAWRGHLKDEHGGQKVDERECPTKAETGCSLKFTSPTNFNSHLRTAHSLFGADFDRVKAKGFTRNRPKKAAATTTTITSDED